MKPVRIGPDGIPEAEKWQAALSCDKEYDGLFCYGVKTTGVFCRPSCRAKAPARENVLFFDTAEKALDAGFRPCKKCRPDRPGEDGDPELTRRATELFDSEYDRPVSLKDFSERLGVSRNHLARVFARHMGLSPSRYIARLRVDKAARLIAETDEQILDIAYASGFESPSNFYRQFKERTGCTPKEYRRSRRTT
jgi:AraC family transcriptional regulator, regulatory protein of adaptative response / methylphosphotriester-DNA alkyltransferase methyltransferase